MALYFYTFCMSYCFFHECKQNSERIFLNVIEIRSELSGSVNLIDGVCPSFNYITWYSWTRDKLHWSNSNKKAGSYHLVSISLHLTPEKTTRNLSFSFKENEMTQIHSNLWQSLVMTDPEMSSKKVEKVKESINRNCCLWLDWTFIVQCGVKVWPNDVTLFQY